MSKERRAFWDRAPYTSSSDWTQATNIPLVNQSAMADYTLYRRCNYCGTKAPRRSHHPYYKSTNTEVSYGGNQFCVAGGRAPSHTRTHPSTQKGWREKPFLLCTAVSTCGKQAAYGSGREKQTLLIAPRYSVCQPTIGGRLSLRPCVAKDSFRLRFVNDNEKWHVHRSVQPLGPSCVYRTAHSRSETMGGALHPMPSQGRYVRCPSRCGFFHITSHQPDDEKVWPLFSVFQKLTRPSWEATQATSALWWCGFRKRPNNNETVDYGDLWFSMSARNAFCEYGQQWLYAQ